GEEKEVKKWLGVPEDKIVVTVILSACDFMCNFTDGLAIGTTFQDSASSGISTSIAVACHEIPQEIGSFAILINYGIGIIPVTILNLLSIGGAFVGLFLGAGLSENDNIASWMTAFAAGSFLHIAFIDL
ncbi:zinc transporter foi-like, partial [Convolutriloba macropyga]